MSRTNPIIYALYHGDEILTVGTAQELADYLGVKAKTIYFYASDIHLKNIKEDGIQYQVYKVED